MRLLALRDEKIDAAGVGVEALTVGRRQMVVDALGGEANLEHALRLVVLEQRGAQNLRQFAVGAAAQAVHLPQAVLGGDVALRDKHVVLRGGIDVGYAVGIAPYGDGRGETRQMRVAVELRQRGLGGGAKPSSASRASSVSETVRRFTARIGS